MAEFYDLLGAHFGFLLDCSYKRVIKQFRKVGYSPKGAPTDFLDPNVVLAEIPNNLLKD